MYNRYIPQPDGTYRRNRIQEQVRPQRPPIPPKEETCEVQEAPVCPKAKQEHTTGRQPHRKQENSIDGFLHQLLPKDFDTGDLIVVFLLLLMAGDNEEGRSNALMTLVLYFLM